MDKQAIPKEVRSTLGDIGSRLLAWFQVLETGPQKNVILFLGVVKLVSFAPVVGDRVGEYLSVLVKGALGDGLLAGLRSFQLGAGVLVPEGEAAVRADRGKGAVLRMERNVVDSKNILKTQK